MLIEREIEIERPIEAVFAFVADARNDVRWCSKVRSVTGGPERYEVVHKPVPFMRARQLEMTRVREEPPRLVEWRQADGHDVFGVTYSLSAAGEGRTRMRQSSDAELGVPRFLHPLWRHGIGRDLERQLRSLKELLERR
jgi:carbon monoxide dehydrogenase subunit G